MESYCNRFNKLFFIIENLIFKIFKHLNYQDLKILESYFENNIQYLGNNKFKILYERYKIKYNIYISNTESFYFYLKNTDINDELYFDLNKMKNLKNIKLKIVDINENYYEDLKKIILSNGKINYRFDSSISKEWYFKFNNLEFKQYFEKEFENTLYLLEKRFQQYKGIKRISFNINKLNIYIGTEISTVYYFLSMLNNIKYLDDLQICIKKDPRAEEFTYYPQMYKIYNKLSSNMTYNNSIKSCTIINEIPLQFYFPILYANSKDSDYLIKRKDYQFLKFIEENNIYNLSYDYPYVYGPTSATITTFSLDSTIKEINNFFHYFYQQQN